MRKLSMDEVAARPTLERICLYGRAKSGKTRTAMALPKGPKWGKKAYIAVDENSEYLKTVLDKSDVVLFKPGPPEGHTGPFDPLEDFVKLMRMDYKAEDPEIGTLVIDTMSQVVQDLLRAYAENDTVQKNHVKVGIKGTPSYHAQPDKSDFGAAQRSHDFLVQHAFKQPLHIIAIYHEDWVEAKSGGLDELTGGPATVGIAAIREVPKMYDTVLRMVQIAGRFGIQTERQGAWPAEIRHAKVNARLGNNGLYALRDDPTHFWVDYDQFVTPGADAPVGPTPAPPVQVVTQPPPVQAAWA